MTVMWLVIADNFIRFGQCSLEIRMIGVDLIQRVRPGNESLIPVKSRLLILRRRRQRPCQTPDINPVTIFEIKIAGARDAKVVIQPINCDLRKGHEQMRVVPNHQRLPTTS